MVEKINGEMSAAVSAWKELRIKRGWYSTFEEVIEMRSNCLMPIHGVPDKGFRMFILREKDGVYLDFFVILGKFKGKLEDEVYKPIWKIKLGNKRIGSRKNTLDLINNTIKEVFLGNYDYLYKLIPEGPKVIINWSAPDRDPWTMNGKIVEITDDGIKVFINDSRVNTDNNLICECKKHVDKFGDVKYVVPMKEGIDCCAFIEG